MFFAYIITAVIAFMLGRLAEDTAARFLGALFLGFVSMIGLTLLQVQIVSAAVSQATGVATTADTGINVVGAAIAAFAFWQGSLYSKPKGEDAEA